MNLILIEGIPGSGKTTTAKNIASFLEGNGNSVKVFLEGDKDNPVGQLYTKETAPKILSQFKFEDYPFDSWKKLDENSDYLIIESRFLQNIGLAAMLSNCKSDDLFSFAGKIINNISDSVTPKLVYYSHTNPRRHIINAVEKRKASNPPWFPWILQVFENCPWIRERNLKGEEMYFESIVAWNTLQTDIFNLLEMEKLQIVDPSEDWNDSLKSIYSFLS